MIGDEKTNGKRLHSLAQKNYGLGVVHRRKVFALVYSPAAFGKTGKQGNGTERISAWVRTW